MARELKRQHPDTIFLTPKAIVQPKWAASLSAQTIGNYKGQLWEQLDLPHFLKKRGTPLLLNLANTAPLKYKNQAVTIHDLAFLENRQWFHPTFSKYYRFLIPRIAKKAKMVFTVSEFSRSCLLRHLDLTADKITVVPNGVPEFALHPATADAAYPELNNFLLAVGSINPRKNLVGLVEAFSKLPNRNELQLVLVGKKHSAFRTAAPQKGQLNIYFLESVSDGELVSLYQRANMLLAPSFYEGFGLPNLEAMHLGCPVIASDIVAHHEVCGEAAMYVDPKSPSDLATAITQTLTQSEETKARVKVGLERSRHFRFADSGEKLLAALAGIN